MEYRVSYTNRKSIGIYVRNDGSIEVRCPKYVSKNTIEEILVKKSEWINKAREKIIRSKEPIVTDKDREDLVSRAKEIIPKKVKQFSEVMGVVPTSVRIGNAKTYWGCCSKDNKLNFSWRLMLKADNIIDYVVVHELAHIKEHNHSNKFWDEVEKVIPNYYILRKELNKK